MAKRQYKSVRGKLSAEQKRRVRASQAWTEANKDRLTRSALTRKSELLALQDATVALKREREARGLSLTDIARLSGIDKSRLSKLENDPNPNPTLETLTRIADAIGVRLTIAVVAE